MRLREAHSELIQLARDASRVSGGYDLSARLYKLADGMAAVHVAEETSYEDAEKARWGEEDRAVEYLNTNAQVNPKNKSQWWVPPHNFKINRALMNWNFWVFTTLPLFPDKRAYRPATAKLPEGIVIDPHWHSWDKPGEPHMLTVPLAEKLIQIAKGMPTIQETVKRELAWVEEKFSVKIPEAVQSQLINDSPKIALRRMSVNTLRTKQILVPLNGSKSIQLGSFD